MSIVEKKKFYQSVNLLLWSIWSTRKASVSLSQEAASCIILKLSLHSHRNKNFYFSHECFAHLKHFLHKLNNKNTLELKQSMINEKIIHHLNRDYILSFKYRETGTTSKKDFEFQCLSPTISNWVFESKGLQFSPEKKELKIWINNSPSEHSDRVYRYTVTCVTGFSVHDKFMII